MPRTYDFTWKQPLLRKGYFCQLFLELVVLNSFLIAFVLFVCLPLFQYFNLIGRFLLFLGSFLNFPFSDVSSSQRCGANSLPLSLIICSHWSAASRKQCLHRKRKAPFVLIWLVLSAGSFGLCLTVFATCLPIPSRLRPTCSA